MSFIATIGALLRLTPHDDLFVNTGDDSYELDDRTPLYFRVQGHIYDGQIFYALFGRVIAGPERCRGLNCNIIVRTDATDWRVQSRSQVGFVIGPGILTRDHRESYVHPEGVQMYGTPRFSRFGMVEVVEHVPPSDETSALIETLSGCNVWEAMPETGEGHRSLQFLTDSLGSACFYELETTDLQLPFRYTVEGTTRLKLEFVGTFWRKLPDVLRNDYEARRVELQFALIAGPHEFIPKLGPWRPIRFGWRLELDRPPFPAKIELPFDAPQIYYGHAEKHRPPRADDLVES